jgi:hypothetical protein
VETALREELARGDAMLGTMTPILRHLLRHDNQSVFSEAIVARVRGMALDVSRQLLHELDTDSDPVGRNEEADALAGALIAQPPFLAHMHALALEWQLTELLHDRLALDPVLSPLLQALIASPNAVTAAEAMALLAAQARFVQTQRRMQLPLVELPGDLLHASLLALRHHAAGGSETQAAVARAEAAIRSRYDEGRTRLGQIARIVSGMGGGATAALSVTHAGVAIFLTALGLASGQDRDLAVLATCEGQAARLALSLRAAGLKTGAITEQFVALHTGTVMPPDLEMLDAGRAAAILARSTVSSGG